MATHRSLTYKSVFFLWHLLLVSVIHEWSVSFLRLLIMEKKALRGLVIADLFLILLGILLERSLNPKSWNDCCFRLTVDLALQLFQD